MRTILKAPFSSFFIQALVPYVGEQAPSPGFMLKKQRVPQHSLDQW